MQLKQGTLLQGGKYRIERVLEQVGTGITYLAVQPLLERKVYIQEFFMRDFCFRENCNVVVDKNYAEQVDVFRAKFQSDALSQAKDQLDSETKIFDVFEENNTAYYVFLGNEDIVEEQKDENRTEDPHNSDTEDTTIIGNDSIDVEMVQPTNDNKSTQPYSLFWKKNRAMIIICLVFVVIGIICISIGVSRRSDSSELADTTAIAVDSLEDVYEEDSLYIEDDVQGLSQSCGLKDEFDKYITMSNESLEKAKKNPHKPSTVRNILDARYYYYDKADKINVELNGERLSANQELDRITEEEFQYWLNEAKKCGSAKSNYQQKRTYLKRARSLASKHQNLLDAQIKWIDDQLNKKKR